jgi:hypothetical protein
MAWLFDALDSIPEPVRTQLQHPERLDWRYLIVLLAIPLFTYSILYISFKLRLWWGSGSIPTVPYWFPVIGHTRTFAAGDEVLSNALL